jgi:DNA excision repair protein ERCC-6
MAAEATDLELGARGEDAAALDERIVAAVERRGGGELSGDEPEALAARLRAVRREARAVRSAVEPPPAAAEPEDGEDGEAPAAAAEDAEAPALAGGELHRAVMRRRLADLEAQEAALEATLARAGGAPPARPAPPAAVACPAAKKRRVEKVRFELEEADLFDAAEAAAGAAPRAALVETERDRLIRTGVLTPFDRLDGYERQVAHGPRAAAADASVARVGEAVRAARAARPAARLVDASELPRAQAATRRVPEGFWRASASGAAALPKLRRPSALPRAARRRRRPPAAAVADADAAEDGPGSEGSGEGGSSSDDSSAAAAATAADAALVDAAGELDDADAGAYAERRAALARGARRRGCRRAACRAGTADNDGDEADGAAASPASDSEDEEPEDVEFYGGLRIPGALYARLFDYQRTGVKWLWELHAQRAGGIVGDEMGLGKTVTVAAFLAGLHHSGLHRPALVVCPATVLRQWLRELRIWYPPFRVAILHESSGGGGGGGAAGRARAHGAVLREVAASGAGVLLTTYEQLRLRRADFLAVRWGYVILDEGHRIRNPDAEVTLAAKQLPTVHRLILSGTPIQNRLAELWSLFDFVFPGKLGTLPVFQAQFAIPIAAGGYAGASPLAAAAAYRCAVVLRDLVAPYLLRRRKADVAASLPRKTERVLFCALTPEQRALYRAYLASREAADILAGDRGALAGIDVLRKICNHPDLLERATAGSAPDYGAPARSGKLAVLERLLAAWAAAGHKALVFAQTQQALDIIEKAVAARGWSYHRMDGATPVAARPRLVDDFNARADVFAFLLTTRVGGLGVNLTGANRCVIFDPDWNP